MSPKSARYVELMNTVTEMSKDCLNVLQYSNVIVSSAVAFVVLYVVDHLKQIS